MAIRKVTSIEYSLLHGQLDDLPEDEANELRKRLSEKYFAYLDKLMQLKKAYEEYESVRNECLNLV